MLTEDEGPHSDDNKRAFPPFVPSPLECRAIPLRTIDVDSVFTPAIIQPPRWNRKPTAACLLATGNWQLATGNWQLATGNWQLATGGDEADILENIQK